MEFHFLLKKVLEDEKVKGLLEDNYFLSSCFCMPKVAMNKSIDAKEWTIHFYNPKTKKVVGVVANEEIRMEEPEDADSEMNELKIKDVIDPITTANELIKSAGPVSSMIMILHKKQINKKDRIVWTFVFVQSTLNMIAIDVDARTGKKLNTEKTSIAQRISRAS